MDDAIERVKRGEIEAFETVVRQTATALRAYLALYLREPEDINDIAQETYVYAFEHVRDYERGTDFVAYLKTIARYQTLKQWRARQRKSDARERYVRAVQDRLRLEAVRAESATDRLVDALRVCMERLPRPFAEMLRLKYAGGLSLKDLAKQLDRTVGAVGVALFRARGALADCIERAEG